MASTKRGDTATFLPIYGVGAVERRCPNERTLMHQIRIYKGDPNTNHFGKAVYSTEWLEGEYTLGRGMATLSAYVRMIEEKGYD